MDAIPDNTDILPVYDGNRDLSVFRVLIVYRVASRLGLTRTDLNPEDEMIKRIRDAKPELPVLIDELMEAYQNWSEAQRHMATSSILEALQAHIDRSRVRLSIAVAN